MDGWSRAWPARDADAVAALYADDAVFVSHPFREPRSPREYAAWGFADQADEWLALTGTSMASPFVTGVVGLMLAIQPRLTAAQIEAILRRTAKPLPGVTFEWTNDAGFGVIDPEACLAEVQRVNERKDLG